MNNKINIFIFRILSTALVMIILFLLTANANKTFASDNKQEEICQNHNDCDLSEKEVVEAITSLRNKYYEVYCYDNNYNSDETMEKIKKLSEYIESKTMNSNIEANRGNRELVEFNVSPNCTCDWLNYYSGEPCANCQYYCAVRDSVYAILAGFYVRGWSLAADLLTHNLANTVFDSDYYPNSNLTSALSEAGQIADIRFNEKMSDAYAQDEPGWANGIFASTIEGDVYNALGKFYYAKNYYSSGYISISIVDRYDWHRGSGCPGGALIGVLADAQDLGIVVPFYTCIDIVTEGYSAFAWNYGYDCVNIVGYHGQGGVVSFPTDVIDIRCHQLNMPRVYITNISNNAFKNCSNITSISMPNTVVSIGQNSFENCTNLLSITLSNNLTAINNAAFKGCTSLTSISIPSTVTSIGDDAFKNCSALTSVVVGRNAAPITTLGSNAFSGCPSSLQITAPQNRVGDYKNDINWFAHRNKIPFNPNSYYAYYVNNASNINITNNISAGYNIVYKLIVSDTNTYKIESSSTYNVMLKIYDSNMMLLNSNVNILSCYLTSGSTYYLSIEFNNASFSGTISTNIIQDSNHYHNYSYSWNSYINHRKYCACGNSSLKAHVVSPDAFNNGQQYAECTLCHGLVSIGANPMSQNNYPYTLNGSFILPNGVIVLVEEDYEAYMNDTLVFINPNDNIDRGNTFIPCLIRREENYWSSLS